MIEYSYIQSSCSSGEVIGLSILSYLFKCGLSLDITEV